MARRKKGLRAVIGLLLGVLAAHVLKDRTNSTECHRRQRSFVKMPPSSAVGLNENETWTNSDKTLLLVGVMTAQKYLDSRADAVFNTWGSDLPGKIIFFSSASSYSEDLPLVPLPGVDDSYPPQKKSFMMLQYMYEHFGDRFEWFMRADDDVYVRTDRLENLLRSVDSRKAWFIGQAGKGVNEELGLLALEQDENFCMGGPGVILSRETLKRIAPHIRYCLDHLYTTHEDVELGRCVRRFANVSCTWSYEMQSILYHNRSGQDAFTGNLKQKEVHQAITMHPVKKPSDLYRLHDYIKGLKVQSLQQENVQLQRDIQLLLTKIGIKRADDLSKEFDFVNRSRSVKNSVLGVPVGLHRFRPKSLDDVLIWDLIVYKSLHSHTDLNPRRKLGSSLKEGLDDVIREVMEIINRYSKQRGRVIDFREILYGYWRLDPVHGVDVVLDMLLTYRKYRGHKMTVPVRRHAYLQQTFTGMEIRELSRDSEPAKKEPKSQSTNKILDHLQAVAHQGISQLSENLLPLFAFSSNPDKESINFILPLSGRCDTFVRFLQIYEEVCLKGLENTKLTVVLYRNRKRPDDYEKSVRAIENLQRTYKQNVFVVLEQSGDFSRGQALEIGASICDYNELMFFIDVDIVLNSASLVRVRYNTVRHKQLYFPIVFSQYNPLVVGYRHERSTDYFFKQTSVADNEGFWRQFGFGIVSLYKSDFQTLGGLNTSITGWGMEDVSFYDKVIKSKLQIFRAPDPGLVHVFHDTECGADLNQSQREMCLGTKASTLGSLKYLQEYVWAHRGDLLSNRNFKNGAFR